MKTLLIIVMMLGLAACGAGGGGDTPPAPTTSAAPASTPTPTPTPAAGITISGKVVGAQTGMVVMLECVRPIAEPLSQIGCYLSGTNMGSILESSAVVDANGSYVFETVRTQYNQPLGGLPIPVGYVWKVIPYWCSMYSYQGVYSYPLAPPPYTCSPAERIFDLTGSVTGMDFFMWPTQ